MRELTGSLAECVPGPSPLSPQSPRDTRVSRDLLAEWVPCAAGPDTRAQVLSAAAWLREAVRSAFCKGETGGSCAW